MMGCLLVIILLLGPAPLAHSHPLAPSLLEVEEVAPGQVRVRWKTPALRVPGSRLRPLFPPECTAAGDPVISSTGADVVEEWQLACASRTVVGRRFAVEDIAASKADVLIRVKLADGRRLLSVLRPDRSAFVVPAGPRARDIVSSYLTLGVEHILTGADHLLFVLGLVLLVGRGRPLLWTVTAFTAGHSVTLSLAAVGVVQLAPGPIEVLIAFSIFVLAVELGRRRAPRTAVAVHPWTMAFAFGLLHGLGFAGALAEVGLPSGDIPPALFAFNVGIEIGQLGFVAGVLILQVLVRPVSVRAPAPAALVPPYAIGSLAAYWLLQRIAVVL